MRVAQIFRRGSERIWDLSWEALRKEVTLAVESEVTQSDLNQNRNCSDVCLFFLTSFVSFPPAAAEQHHRVRVFSGGVPTAAGGVLVPLLLLLSAVPGGPGISSGSDREPAHRHGLSAPEGEWTACRGRCVPVGVSNEEVTPVFVPLCFRASCHTCCRASPWITCTFPTTSTCSQRRRRQSQKVKRQPVCWFDDFCTS